MKFLSLTVSQIQDTFTTFSNHFSRPGSSGNIGYSLTSKLIPGYTILFWLTLSLNEKDTNDPENEVGFT